MKKTKHKHYEKGNPITLLVFAILFCFLTIDAKTKEAGILFARSAAGAFSLLLVALSIL